MTNIKIIPTTELIRRFGVYANLLPKIGEIILTREGRPFATLKATPEEKNRRLLGLAGILKGTILDSDKFWKTTLKRNNRKKEINI